MSPTEIGNMRLKQVAVTNGFLLAVITIYFTSISIFKVTFLHFYLLLGIVLLIQSVFGFIKGDSTKSIIHIYEQVAIYEKQKMGKEWNKQRKAGFVWNLILSLFLLLQAYWHRDSTDYFQMDIIFMFITASFLLLMINISLIFHFGKVDRSANEGDLKGYTWKSNLIAVAIGIVFAFAMIFITLFYIVS